MVNQLLTTNRLSKTRGRQQILEVLVRSNSPLSGKEIADALNHMVDRTTVYRTLNIFEEKKVVHKILADNVWRYVLLPGKEELEEHVHFKCIRCCRLICMPEVQVNDIKLPEGYTQLEKNILITGICNQCAD